MAFDLIVVTGSTIPPEDPRSGTLSLYLSQLTAAGIETHLDSTLRTFHTLRAGRRELLSFILPLFAGLRISFQITRKSSPPTDGT